MFRRKSVSPFLSSSVNLPLGTQQMLSEHSSLLLNKLPYTKNSGNTGNSGNSGNKRKEEVKFPES